MHKIYERVNAGHREVSHTMRKVIFPGGEPRSPIANVATDLVSIDRRTNWADYHSIYPKNRDSHGDTAENKSPCNDDDD
jgi:hypothetical protein